MAKINFEDLPHLVAETRENVKLILAILSKQATTTGSIQTLPEIMTVKQAAEFLHLAPSTIYRLVNTSQICFMKKTGRLYFDRRELISWLKDGRQLTQDELTHLVDDAIIINSIKENKDEK
jgi:excisionase family DNA binding protein